MKPTRSRLPFVPVEPDWGDSNYKDIVRLQPVAVEKLPRPYVHYPDTYGTWIAFQRYPEDQPAFCACHKAAMLNFLRLNEQSKTYHWPKDSSILRHFLPLTYAGECEHISTTEELASSSVFESELCHVCQQRVPSFRWSNLGEHSTFSQHFGWYVQVAFYEFGIDPIMFDCLADVMPAALSAQFQLDPTQTRNVLETFRQEHNLGYGAFAGPPGLLGEDWPEFVSMIELQRSLRRQEKQIRGVIEAIVRERIGYSSRKKMHNHESILFMIVRSLFPGEQVKRHYRGPELNGLEIDIFLPTRALAIEYQGQQHFEPFVHLGGEKALRTTKRRDRLKAKLCREKGLTLIHFSIADKLTEGHVADRLRHVRPDIFE
ncbi:MAG TPA: hypothetical protein VGW57_13750 [Chthoniobacterales bacterium]|nr:hypothetical protein [Chthoniobacterales bacterium]